MLTSAQMLHGFRPALVAAVLTILGCSASSWNGRVYRSGNVAFRVGEVPGSWHPMEASDGVLAFRDEATPASIAVTGRCGKDGDDVPLESLTAHLFLNFTERRVDSQTRFPLDGREALRTELWAKLDGVEKRFTVVVLKKDGCVYDFMHIAPPAAPEAGRLRFITFVEGFSTRVQ